MITSSIRCIMSGLLPSTNISGEDVEVCQDKAVGQSLQRWLGLTPQLAQV